MTRLHRIFAITAVVLFAVVTEQAAEPRAAGVDARLVVPDTRVLPGVPFDMWVEVRNASSREVGIGLCADMIVQRDAQEPFAITFGGEERPPYPMLLEGESYLQLQPGQHETLALPILSELAGPLYFDDPRLSPPGHYRIALRLGYCWPGFTTPQDSLLPPDYAGIVPTNSVEVERIEPAGSDAAVWRRMQAAASGGWIATRWPPAVTDEILTKYADSNYVPYALIASSFGNVSESRLRRLDDAAKHFAHSPVAEVLQVEAWHVAASVRPMESAARLTAIQVLTRPTTRVRAFGRDHAPPCRPSTSARIESLRAATPPRHTPDMPPLPRGSSGRSGSATPAARPSSSPPATPSLPAAT